MGPKRKLIGEVSTLRDEHYSTSNDGDSTTSFPIVFLEALAMPIGERKTPSMQNLPRIHH